MMKVWTPTTDEINAAKAWGTWSKEISEFPWYYDERETCLIIEGSAEVTDSDGNKISFKAGDMVCFDKGVKCTWKITSDIHKHFNFG